MPKAVFFDLGNTLAEYYQSSEFPAILEQSINNVVEHLESLGVSIPPDVAERVKQENYTPKDFQVRPLEERLGRIFQLDQSVNTPEFSLALCRSFMKPTFSLGRVYDDVVAPMRDLRTQGYKIGIVSNTPWGSPASLWREELIRLGLDKLTDKAVFCRDVGWRKPDSRIFTHALRELNVTAIDSVFIGDEPRWDLVGPKSVGMPAIVIDRYDRFSTEYPNAIRSLDELSSRLSSGKL